MTDALRDAIAKALPCTGPKSPGYERCYDGMHLPDCPARHRKSVADAIEPVIRSEVEDARQKAFEKAAKLATSQSYYFLADQIRQLGVSGK